jgi:TPR repeat protein
MIGAQVDHSSRFAVHLAASAFFLVISSAAFSAFGSDANIPQLQAAADKGLVPKQLELAAAYFTGSGVPQDAKMAAHWYEKAAESGDPEAENEIAFLYQTGTGVSADLARALHWYQLSAASGFLKAKVNMGVLYVWGIGVPKDELLAAQLFREAVAKGSGAAASYLGDMCYFGMGMKQDMAAAESWYAAGARLRDPLAAYNLASLFSVNRDHVHDLPKAVALLRISVTAGYVPAMHSLGLILINHPQLAKSSTEGGALLEAASEAGSWRSSVVLGALARDGKAGHPDTEGAYYDFQLAVLQGGDEARRLVANDLTVLSGRLSAEQATLLSSKADAWSRQHPMALSFVYQRGEKSNFFPSLARSVPDEGVHAGHLILPPQA